MEYISNTFHFWQSYKFGYCKVSSADIWKMLRMLEQQLRVETNYEILEEISEETLKTAGDLYVYLLFCPPTYKITEAQEKLKNFFRPYTPKEILLVLNKMSLTESSNFTSPGKIKNIFKKLRKVWNPHYVDIQHLLGQNIDDRDFQVQKNLDLKNISKLVNHPVHIGNYSQSALIPFCYYGKWNETGKNISSFPRKICNNFKQRIRNDQICYEIDPNELIDENNAVQGLQKGIYMIIDENIDRQTLGDKNHWEMTSIYLDTIGKIVHVIKKEKILTELFRFTEANSRLGIQLK